MDSARRQLYRLAVAMILVNLLLPLVLLGHAAASGQEYWELFQGEENAVTWFSSIQLLVVAAAAWWNHRVGGLLRPERSGARRWIWALFALGFVALSIDERFELHERLRDEWLAPSGIATDIGFLEPGDLGLYIVLAVGLVMTVFLLGELRERPLSLALFSVAVVLAGVVTVVDSVRGEIAYSWEHGWFWNYVFEETGELWAQLLFLLSFLVLLSARLGGGIDGERLAGAARRDTVRFAVGVGAINLLLPVGFLVWSIVTGTSFYEMFWGERDAISWFSSVQLLMIAVAAYLVHESRRLEPGHAARGVVERWIWLVFAGGFLFLALDERFEWHESLRDDLLAPGGWFGNVPGLKAGDVGLYLYLVVGLAFAWFLFRELRKTPPAQLLFVAALVMSALIVVEDGLPTEVRDRLPLPGFWDSAFEEVGEIWTQYLFLLAFLIALIQGRFRKPS